MAKLGAAFDEAAGEDVLGGSERNDSAKGLWMRAGDEGDGDDCLLVC